MKNRFCELMGIEKPIVLAPMIYVCNAELAAAVSNAGGLGMLGMNSRVDYPEPNPKLNGENLREEIKKTRELTDKPFAVNYLPEQKGMDPQLSFAAPFKDIVIQEKVPAVVINGWIDYGTTADDVAEFKKHGVKVLFKQHDLSMEGYRKAIELGADAIIVCGIDGGGHLSNAHMSLLTALPRITDAFPDVPVIAGGGIGCVKSAKAAEVMGADAIYIGTYFLAAKECRTHPTFKQAILNANAEDLFTWQSCVEKMISTKNLVGRTCYAMGQGGASQNDIGKHYNGIWNISMLQGDIENGIVSIGGGCNYITEIKSCKEIVDELCAAFE